MPLQSRILLLLAHCRLSNRNTIPPGIQCVYHGLDLRDIDRTARLSYQRIWRCWRSRIHFHPAHQARPQRTGIVSQRALSPNGLYSSSSPRWQRQVDTSNVPGGCASMETIQREFYGSGHPWYVRPPCGRGGRHMNQNLAQRHVVRTLHSQVVYSPSMQVESFIRYMAYCLS